MPPVAFLGLLQTNYLLAYPACSYGTTTPLVVASGVTTLLVVGVSVAAWRWRQRADDPPARMFLGLMGILVNTLVLLMVIGLIVPPLILQPCD